MQKSDSEYAVQQKRRKGAYRLILHLAWICALFLRIPTLHAQEFGANPHRLHDEYVSFRAGAGVGMLGFANKPQRARPAFSYHLGVGSLLFFPYNLELEAGLQLLWNGGYIEHSFPYGDGEQAKLSLGIRFLSLNLPVLCNYRLQLTEDYSLCGGIGFALSCAYWGRVKLRDEGERVMIRDMRYGFGANDHIQPFNVGAVGQLGFRWQDYLQLNIWFEYDLAERNMAPHAPLPDLSPEAVMRYDRTADLMHHFGATRTMAGGISAYYLFPMGIGK